MGFNMSLILPGVLTIIMKPSMDGSGQPSAGQHGDGIAFKNDFIGHGYDVLLTDFRQELCISILRVMQPDAYDGDFLYRKDRPIDLFCNPANKRDVPFSHIFLY